MRARAEAVCGGLCLLTQHAARIELGFANARPQAQCSLAMGQVRVWDAHPTLLVSGACTRGARGRGATQHERVGHDGRARNGVALVRRLVRHEREQQLGVERDHIAYSAEHRQQRRVQRAQPHQRLVLHHGHDRLRVLGGRPGASDHPRHRARAGRPGALGLA